MASIKVTRWLRGMPSEYDAENYQTRTFKKFGLACKLYIFYSQLFYDEIVVECNNRFKIGDKVWYDAGKYRYNSSGNLPCGDKHRGEMVYVTYVSPIGEYGYHISTGNKLGDGDLGWVKAEQISAVL